MRHLKNNRNGTLVENFRVLNPHRNVLLPPLPPDAFFQRNQLITTKIVVNKNKSTDPNPDFVAIGRNIEGLGTSSRVTDPLLRISQLEQNIRFLQEQHNNMLIGLHEEIDSLRQRNRDLQFQLVFTKGPYNVPSSLASTPEDEQKTRVLSPKQVNVTPLQVELLEKEIGELKIQLKDVDTKNSYLTAIVDEQKKKLEKQKEQQESQSSQSEDEDLTLKIENYEALVKKLRNENEDLKKEVGDLKNNTGGNHSGNGRGRYRGNNHYRGHRFPPLHTQSYWQGGGRSLDIDTEQSTSGSLPHLNNPNSNGQSSSHQGHRNDQHYSGGGGNRRQQGNRYNNRDRGGGDGNTSGNGNSNNQREYSERKYTRGNRGNHKS